MNDAFTSYRDKESRGSESDDSATLGRETDTQSVGSLESADEQKIEMDPDQLKTVVQVAIASALEAQSVVLQLRDTELRNSIDAQIQALSNRISATSITAPPVEAFKPVEIRNDVQCNEPLDAVKCLPEFTGAPETYASWRQAAVAAYAIYKPYDGSSGIRVRRFRYFR